MIENPPMDPEDVEHLKERIRKLATDKSHLQLVLNLMSKVNAASGLDSVIDALLKNVLEVIGGTNVILYYQIDQDLHYADLFGRRTRLERIEDPLVRQAFEDRVGTEKEGDFKATRMQTPEFSKAYTWVFPLCTGGERVGVLKLENLHLSSRQIYDLLSVFFSFAASILKNEIQGHTQIRQACDRLARTNEQLAQEILVRKQAEEQLRLSNEDLETRVRERTGDLTLSNQQLQHELSERKKAEEALRESEERFRRVSSMISDITYSCTRSEEGGYSINWMSGAAERICGYSIEEIQARRCWRFLVVEEDYPLFDRNVIGLQPGGQASCELRIRHRNGGLVVLTSYAECIRSEECPGHHSLFGALVDITGRKRAEEEKTRLENQLQQAQKMESVGRLAGGVAHDFNNMLNVILGHAEMALDRIRPSDPVSEDVEAIRKAAERSAELTRQLLAFARKQTVSPRVLDLNLTIETMLRMLERLIGEDIQLLWNPARDLGRVRLDPSQINQILTNLCINARDAIAGVGTITIETGNSTVDRKFCEAHPDFLAGDYIRLAVSDTGCGMDAETLSHIFEPFFTTKGLGKGTGLGLSTVYGIVKQNNGFIHVSSNPGQGSTFAIYLPPERESQMAALWPEPDGRSHPPRKGKATILLVEDEPAILKLTEAILSNQGYTVLAADTPGKAMRLAEKHSEAIDLLMTDVVMPEMNGRDLAEKLLAGHPEIRCIFTSGYPADVIAEHGVLQQGVCFIEKPYSLKDVIAKVREALENRPSFPC